MTEILEPRWLVHARRQAGDNVKQIFALRADSMVSAIKKAKEKLSNRDDGPYSIVFVEGATAEPESLINLDATEETANG